MAVPDEPVHTTDGALGSRIAALRPVTDVGDATAAAAIRERVLGRAPAPVTLGRYVVLERIGAGGMGTVYAAWDRELDRKIALKVLHRRHADPSHTDAIAREARVLARLADPYIVAVYDVGIDPLGPWIAMELVDGIDLRRWCSQRPRAAGEIADVIGKAALGLSAAHAQGLVHGDVKPENLLVTASGSVRWVDFGLAREIGGRGRGGTRGYLAPEVVAHRPVDARSDVWALCQTAYEAFTGARPAASLGRRPAVIPRPLWRTIVAGLAEDPRDRPDAMAVARAAAAGRGPGSGALVIFVVSGLLALPLALGRDAPCELASTQVQIDDDASRRIRAHMQALGPLGASTWERTREHLDRYAAAWQDERRAACALASDEARARRAACLGARADAHALLLARLLDADASTLERVGQAVGELGDPTDCAAVDAELASREATALLGSAKVLEGLADHPAGLELADAAVAAATRDDAPCLLADALRVRGSLRSRLARDREADEDLEQSFWSATAHRCDDVAARAGLRLLRVIGDRLADPERATQWLGPVRSAIARNGDRAGDRVVEAIEIAVIAQRLQQPTEVRAQALRAVEIGEAEQVEPSLRARAHALLGVSLTRAGDPIGALAQHQAALSLIARVKPPEHPDVAVAWAGLAGALSDVGEIDAALAGYEHALTILRARVPKPPAQYPVVLANYAQLLRDAGRLDEAAATAELALAFYADDGRGPDHPDVVLLRVDRAWIDLARGHLDAARRELERLRVELPPEDPRQALVDAALAEAALAAGDHDAAEIGFTRAIERFEATDASPDEIDDARTGLGRARLARGNVSGARIELELAWSRRQQRPGGSRHRAETAWALAQALQADGRPTRARELATTARDEALRARPPAREIVAAVDAMLRAARAGPTHVSAD